MLSPARLNSAIILVDFVPIIETVER